MMGWIGTRELAAHGIAIEVAALAFMVHLGLSNAATVRTGLAAGAGDARGMRDGARAAISMSLSFGALVVALFLIWPRPLIAAFLNRTDPDGPAIVAIGVTLLAYGALFQIADATQVMALGLLRGIRDTRVPMLIAAVSYWLVGIPAGYALAFPLGLSALRACGWGW